MDKLTSMPILHALTDSKTTGSNLLLLALYIVLTSAGVAVPWELFAVMAGGFATKEAAAKLLPALAAMKEKAADADTEKQA